MQIIPVLDILDGHVVRGIAGRRDEYKPVVSRLTKSSAPVDVARAVREHFGLSLFYLADLDALQGETLAFPVYDALHEDGFTLWVDAGVRDAAGAKAIAAMNVARTIVASESLRRLDDVQSLVEHGGTPAFIFSLDLKNGQMMGASISSGTNPLDVAEKVIAWGIQQIIVLDVAHVGMASGSATMPLCRELLRAHPKLQVFTGGGVRHRGDLLALQSIGVAGVLVASALHDGRLSTEDLTLVQG